MKFENTKIEGIYEAIKGMRNPMNSWDRSDSTTTRVGDKDIDLAKKLILAGPEHCKFLRQIQVWVDITAPRYWWQEFDTYGFTSKNSCSTMHTILKREITKEDFEGEVPEVILNILNMLRLEARGNMQRFRELKNLLPEGFLQKRTVNMSYQTIRNMYHQRENHGLTEWSVDFVNFVNSLPYSDEFLTLEKKDRFESIMEAQKDFLKNFKDIDKQDMLLQTQLGLYVEAGELFNEIQNFKYWDPEADLEKDKAGFEIADCIMILFSISQMIGIDEKELYAYISKKQDIVRERLDK